MNKKFTKTSTKSLRSYNLSEIREQRILSPTPKISTRPKGSRAPIQVDTLHSRGKSSGTRQFRRDQLPQILPKTFSKNSSLNSLKVSSFSKTSNTSSQKKKSEIPPKVSKVSPMKLTELRRLRALQGVGPGQKALQDPQQDIKKSFTNFPCLFIADLQKKGKEIIGTPLMNRITRFITKQGKKAKAFKFMDKVRSFLTKFEADKKDSQEISSKPLKSDRKPPKGHQSPEDKKPPEEGPSSKDGKKKGIHLENTEKKTHVKFKTYKSQKLSEFLSRQNLKSSKNSEKSLKNTVKFLKKTFNRKEGYSPISPRLLIDQAISHVKPFVEVKKVRVAGSTYQVPAILQKHRQENYAIKWILQSALERHKKNPSQSFEYYLAFEIYEASQKQGQARMKRNELHKLAESHRAFAHFRWW